MTSFSRICQACQTSNPPQAAFCFGCGKPLGAPAAQPELLYQRYHLLHRLGEGGFGAVYQAEDTQLGGRLVAIKEMRPQSGLSAQENAEATEAFKKEALLLAELMHPNLPRIYDHFSESRNWYLVMDYIEGETLEALLGRTPGGYLPLVEALAIGLQLCDVLEYLHTRQPPIIFRDLKPLNIMHTSSGHLYLIDFGIARLFKPGQMKDTIAFGSPGYAAPEQYGKTQTTPRSDIYSLGATLHQMLTGIDPSLNPFRFASLRLPGGRATPRALAELVEAMLEMDERRRPANMQVVKKELQTIATSVASGSFIAIKTPRPAMSVPALSPDPMPPSTTYGELRCTHQAGKLKGPQGQSLVRSLSWSPDSKWLISAGDGNSVEIWNAADSKQISEYHKHTGRIRMALWSPDGKYIASASEDRTVQVWEATSGQVVRTYQGHTHIVTGLAWSPDSRCIASSSVDKSVQVWDVQSGYTYVNYTRHPDVVYRVAWSPNGRYLASGGYDSVVRVWEAMSGRHLFTYRGHSALIFALGWSPDGKLLASGSHDTTVQVWSPFDAQFATIYHAHTGQVQSLDWSPDGTRIVSSESSDTSVTIWDASSGSEIFVFRGHEGVSKPATLPLRPASPSASSAQRYGLEVRQHVEISALAWSPDGMRIASADTNNLIHVWSAL